MHNHIIVFLTFPSDGAWKVYRDGELVAVYQHQAEAERAAAAFAGELSRNGKPVSVNMLLTYEDAVAHGAGSD